MANHPTPVLERMPSLIASNTVTSESHAMAPALCASEIILTPTGPANGDVLILGDSKTLLDLPEVEAPGYESKEPKKASRKLNLSRSIPNLRRKPNSEKKETSKSSRGRRRALSASNEQLLPPIPSAGQPATIPSTASRPSRPKQQRSGSSFSSFIRKITGRSPSPAKGIPSPVAEQSATTRSRSTDPLKGALLPRLDTRPQANRAPATPAPTAACPQLPLPLEEDPRRIPLPPSPVSTPVLLHEPSDKLADSALAPPIVVSGPSLKRVRQTGMLSLEGFTVEEADEVEAMKEDDVVQPLAPLQIPSRLDGSDDSPTTPTGMSTSSDEIVKPTSATEGKRPPEQRVVEGSPSRIPDGVERKQSKIRKSMFGIPDSLNVSITRKTSQRSTPTSYDTYATQIRRAAADRVSRAPIIHSRASVAKEAREIKDREQIDMTETFFLS